MRLEVRSAEGLSEVVGIVRDQNEMCILVDLMVIRGIGVLRAL